eukprot:1237825-Pyramimonas_sp.AAC.1
MLWISLKISARIPLFFFGVDGSEDHRWDMADPETVAPFGELAEDGLVDAVIGSHPCATWSSARFRDIGLRPFRFRRCLLGRADLATDEAGRVVEANVLSFNFLGLCEQ